MNEIKVLIFDLDNTLINYGGVTQQAWQLTSKKLCENFDLEIDDQIIANEIIRVNNLIWEDEDRRPKGNFSFYELRKSIVREALDNLNMKNQDMCEFLVQNYSYYKHQAVYVFEDVKDTLKELRKRGYTIALLTNGDTKMQREKLDRFGLEKYFDGIFIDGEQGVGKPERKAYENVLKYFHVEASEAWMIGDHYLWEVVAPINYGLHAIWVKRFGSIVPDNITVKADYVIDNIAEILTLIP